MRLPHLLLDRLCFTFTSAAELVRALGETAMPEEIAEIERLAALQLPPITSPHALATMLGVNDGLVWSMINRPQRHYRTFAVPKGRQERVIHAPRVALKVFQKWLSVRLVAAYPRPSHVFGFTPGFSHIDAAAQHLGARWTLGVDIHNFFPTTPEWLVNARLQFMGFNALGAKVVARLACFQGNLAQGAPSSPVLSNICFSDLDQQLADVAVKYHVRMSRYADDIVFSGIEDVPAQLKGDVQSLFSPSPWKLAQHKISLDVLPDRLKIHGLLVHGEKIRLIKGYRNQIRAYQHLMDQGAIGEADKARIRGHLSYAAAVDKGSVSPMSEPLAGDA